MSNKIVQEKKQMLKEKHKPNENTTASKALAKRTYLRGLFWTGGGGARKALESWGCSTKKT